MSNWDLKSFRPSGKCQPTFSNDRTTVPRPVSTPNYVYDQEPPRLQLTKDIGLIFEWDNGERLAPNIPCYLTFGGETHVYGSLDGGKLYCLAPPGKYEAQLLEHFEAQERLSEGRQKLKEALDRIIESEKEEAAKLQKIQAGRSDISNHAHLVLAVGRGYFHSAWGLIKSVKEVSDLVNPFTQLSNALTAAWTAKRDDRKPWTQSFLDTYSEEQHRELAEALGFDYRKVTREQLAEAYDITCFIYEDAPSREILEEFVRTYISVQNPEELAEFSGAVAFEIVLSALLIVFTGGVGLAARAALSVRFLELLKPQGEALRDLATFIVKATIKSAELVKGMTGTGAVTVTIRRPKKIIPNQISTPPEIKHGPLQNPKDKVREASSRGVENDTPNSTPPEFSRLFDSDRPPKASELKQYAESQGWKSSQTENGPLKYIDDNGIARVTIKKGSPQAPGSSHPHVELKNHLGQRTDSKGNIVTRKSLENHTPIDFDL